MKRRSSDNISPTAHYTGAVWVRNGLSHSQLETKTGSVMYQALVPMNSLARVSKQASLEGMLLARHTVIDQLLCESIDSGDVSQVIEIAAGLSPRGWRLSEKYPRKLTYVETDLPGMLARKRKLLVEVGALPKRHRIEPLDALLPGGPGSLEDVASRLDPDKGLCIITEGLLNYFDQPRVELLWQRIASTLSSFRKGLYLSDIHLAAEQPKAVSMGFRFLLSSVVRGRVHFHFQTPEQARNKLVEAGFEQAVLNRTSEIIKDDRPDLIRSARLVRIIAANTTPQ